MQVVHDGRPFGKNVSANAFEVHIVKLHVDESLLAVGNNAERPHVDADRGHRGNGVSIARRRTDPRAVGCVAESITHGGGDAGARAPDE